MSIINETVAPCTGCGERHPIKVYRSINIAQDPSLKEKVKDGSLFVWECPSCGRKNLAKYETLYHDPASSLMIWLTPNDDIPASQMQAILNHCKAMGEYTLRRVSDVGSLMEKVLIFEAGLDDVVVEMCKYVTKAEMASKASESDLARILSLPMHFFRLAQNDEQKYLTLSFPDGGQMTGCNIGWNVYEDCQAILQRNPSIKVEEGFAKVDYDWLMSFIA